MRFPNAHKGVKKLFIAEIISIVAGLLGVVGAVLAIVGLTNEAVLASAGGLLIAMGFALILSFILTLIGLHQGGKDEVQIRFAFFFIIAAILLTLVQTIFGFIANPVLVIIARVLGTLSDICTTLSLVYTLLGISRLADELSDERMSKRGKFLALVVTVLFVATVILGLFPNFVNENSPEFFKTLVAIFGLIGALVELIAYVLIFIYYGRATKMLKK